MMKVVTMISKWLVLSRMIKDVLNVLRKRMPRPKSEVLYVLMLKSSIFTVHSSSVLDHGFPIHSTMISLSSRIADFYGCTSEEITSKEATDCQKFLKGRIDLPKFKSLKRTVMEEGDDSNAGKKAFYEMPPVQVEIWNLPQEWVREGIVKISNIAEAYGPGGESILEKVFQEENVFVVIFKKSIYAQKFYDSLNDRQVDEYVIKVSLPHEKSQ